MSTKLPSLSHIDAPEASEKRLSTEDFYRLSVERRRQLAKAGDLQRMLSEKSRTPANTAFVL